MDFKIGDELDLVDEPWPKWIGDERRIVDIIESLDGTINFKVRITLAGLTPVFHTYTEVRLKRDHRKPTTR